MTSEEAKRRGAMGRGRRKTLTPEQREACRIRLAASRANRHPNNGKWVLSFSGGKDSLAILHVILRDNLPLDRVVTFLSDWEFPQLQEHLAKVERMTGIAITRVGPRVSWWQMRDRWGWPYAHCRWCSGDKGATIDRETKGCNKYVGLAADEAHRAAKYMRNGISHKRATTGICARLAAATPPVKVLPRCFSVPSPMGEVTQKK